jgi:hypothetical protein
MAVATLDAVRVQALVPRGDPVGATAAERLRLALGAPLDLAVDQAFQALEQLDAGAVWVIRDVRAQVNVPAGEADPAAQAGRIADAMRRAVEGIVRAGPGTNAVRFAGRADYGASFVQSLVAGSTQTWVYEWFAALRALRPLPAVSAVATALGLPVLDIVAALARTPSWGRIVDGATPPELDRLADTLRAGCGPVVPPAEVVETARRTGADLLATERPAGRAARRLLLLGELITRLGASDMVLAAVWAAEPELLNRPAPSAGEVSVASPDEASRASVSPEPTADDDPRRLPRSPGRDGVALAAPGAVGFMLVADLDGLLPDHGPAAAMADSSPAAAHLRAAVIQAVLGPAVPLDDPALQLAGGGSQASRDRPELTALLSAVWPWVDELADDPVLGWRHAGDAAWLDPEGDRPLVVTALAGALLRRFAGHLLGFNRASAPYLVERVLPPGGVVVAGEEVIAVALPSPPLRIVLQLAGLDAVEVRPRWLDAAVTVTHDGHQ